MSHHVKSSTVLMAAAVAAGLSAFGYSARAAAPTIDGTLDGVSASTYTRFATQTVNSGFNGTGQHNSQLDAGYYRIEGGKLYMFLAGNLESNYNKMAIFFDTRAGGQNVVRTDNTYGPLNQKYGGMTFDTGFSPDYFFTYDRDAANSYLKFAEMNTGGGGLGGDVGTVATPNAGQQGSGTVGGTGGMPTVSFGYNDSNTGGVIDGTGAANQAASEAVTTGSEFSIDLTALGITGNFNIMVGINGSGDDYWSNQFLPGLAAPQGNLGSDGLGNFVPPGQVSGVNFQTQVAGNQYLAIPYTPPSSSWKTVGNGNWNNAANWNGGIPNAADAIATLGTDGGTGAHSVSLDVAVQLQKLTFDSPGSYTIAAGGGTLTIAGNPASPSIVVNQGSHTIAAPLTLGATTNIGVATGASLNVTGDITADTRAVIKSGGGSLQVKRLVSDHLRVSAGTVSIATNGTNTGASRVASFIADTGAALDLKNNDMIIGGGTSSTQVATYLAAGYNFGGFDGTGGIQSSAARNDPNGNKTLGYLTADEYANNNGSPTFDGFTVATGDTLIKYTYYGDVDFNGSIDASDYNLIDFGFASHLTGWANGDADYSGAVDASDYNVIDFAFASQNGVVLRAVQYLDGSNRGTDGMSDPALQEVIKHYNEFGDSYAAGFLAAVPEPTSLGVIGLTAGALMGRRRRRAR